MSFFGHAQLVVLHSTLAYRLMRNVLCGTTIWPFDKATTSIIWRYLADELCDETERQWTPWDGEKASHRRIIPILVGESLMLSTSVFTPRENCVLAWFDELFINGNAYDDSLKQYGYDVQRLWSITYPYGKMCWGPHLTAMLASLQTKHHQSKSKSVAPSVLEDFNKLIPTIAQYAQAQFSMAELDHARSECTKRFKTCLEEKWTTEQLLVSLTSVLQEKYNKRVIEQTRRYLVAARRQYPTPPDWKWFQQSTKAKQQVAKSVGLSKPPSAIDIQKTECAMSGKKWVPKDAGDDDSTKTNPKRSAERKNADESGARTIVPESNDIVKGLDTFRIKFAYDPKTNLGVHDAIDRQLQDLKADLVPESKGSVNSQCESVVSDVTDAPARPLSSAEQLAMQLCQSHYPQSTFGLLHSIRIVPAKKGRRR
jgi:hypothetical protein